MARHVNTARQTDEQTIPKHEVIKLSERDARAFADALADPEPPSPYLRAAAEFYRSQTARC